MPASLYMHHASALGQEEDLRSPGAQAVPSCELPNGDAGN